MKMHSQPLPLLPNDAIALALSALKRNNHPRIALITLVAWVARRGGQVLLQERRWHTVIARSFREITRGKLAFVLLATVVITAQSTLQAASSRYWSADQLVRAFTETFAEGVVVALAMFFGGSILLAWARPSGVVGTVVASLALTVFAAAGCLAGFWLTFDPRFFPPLSFIVASTLRWTIIGGLLFVIDDLIETQRQNMRRLHDGAARVASLGRQSAEARLQLMQAQIEPHFLFNTLANVKRLCNTDPDGGAELFAHLMVYLRAALPRIRETETTLATELSLARSFLAVLKIRMGARLQFSIDVPEACLSLPFPSMVLLTLVENAVKHGLAPAQQGGSIRIAGEQQGGRFSVSVADTGVGFSAKGGSGMGIASIRSRLAAAYGSKAELLLAANSPCGVVASIVIPFTPIRTAPDRPAAQVAL